MAAGRPRRSPCRWPASPATRSIWSSAGAPFPSSATYGCRPGGLHYSPRHGRSTEGPGCSVCAAPSWQCGYTARAIEGATPARLAHAAIVIVVAAAVSARRPEPEPPGRRPSRRTTSARAELGHSTDWSTPGPLPRGNSRSVLSGALLAPWQPPTAARRPNTRCPSTFPEAHGRAPDGGRVHGARLPVDRPGGRPLPGRAAGERRAVPPGRAVRRQGGRRAPSGRRSPAAPAGRPSSTWTRHDRRMVYQDADGRPRHLTGQPGRHRAAHPHVRTARAGTSPWPGTARRITDTQTWTTTVDPRRPAGPRPQPERHRGHDGHPGARARPSGQGPG